jgi:hypothetical protein
MEMGLSFSREIVVAKAPLGGAKRHKKLLPKIHIRNWILKRISISCLVTQI